MTEHDDRCGARTRGAGGGACRQRAGWGTPNAGVPGTRCKLHGGSTGTHLVAAEGARAARALAQLGRPVPTDPVEALQLAVNSAAGLREGLEQLVREAAERGDPQSRALGARLAMYSDSVDRLARVSAKAVDARLGERFAALSEQRVRMFVDLIRRAIDRSGIPPDARAAVERSIGRTIREYTADRERNLTPTPTIGD